MLRKIKNMLRKTLNDVEGLLENESGENGLIESGKPAPYAQKVDYCEGKVGLRNLRHEEIAIAQDFLRDRQTCMYAFGFRLDISESKLQSVYESYNGYISLQMETFCAILFEGQLAGLMSVEVWDEHKLRLATLGLYVGSAQMRGRGIGTAAMTMILRHLFEVLLVDVVELDTAVYNLPSHRLYKKLGFEQCSQTDCLSSSQRARDLEDYAPSDYFRYTKEMWQERRNEPT